MVSSTLVEILEARARDFGGRIAYTYVKSATDPGRSITYQELYQASVGLAHFLLTKVKPGARALLLYPAGIDFVIAFYACVVAGIIAVPLYPPKGAHKFQRLKAIFSDASPEILLTASDFVAAVQLCIDRMMMLKRLQCIATDAFLDDTLSEPAVPPRQSNKIVLLQYTSGSTGSPKGVIVTHQNILHNSALIQRCVQLSGNSCSVCWLPHFHDMGLIDGIIQPLFSGFHGVLLAPEAFVKRPLVWLQLITRFGATHSGGPTSAYSLCLQRISETDMSGLDLSKWRSAYCGAEPIRLETLEAFSTQFGPCGFRAESFYPCYGMAEATLMISGGRLDSLPTVIRVDSRELAQNKAVMLDNASDLATLLVGCGRPRLGTTVRIVNPNTLLPCEDATVGEIWVSGPGVASGYWQQPELSRQVFNAVDPRDPEARFLRTGDLGFIKDGDVFVTGRCKDLLIVNGLNHYPQDIEFTVQACSDAMEKNRGAVFSLECNDSKHVVVVQEIRRSKLATIEPEKLLRLVREAISLHHGLSVSAIILVKPTGVPITSSGKVQRSQCRVHYMEQTLPIIARWPTLEPID